ncbi:S8 family serine peptidase [Prosthecobacter sp. SYSU 5D2]|uniref:S8 family serine peptidase n=1 Tax=Prosthecobacter sp. SYSU 5D2 TaxID=3134134 RepID=UPI0031FEB1FA
MPSPFQLFRRSLALAVLLGLGGTGIWMAIPSSVRHPAETSNATELLPDSPRVALKAVQDISVADTKEDLGLQQPMDSDALKRAGEDLRAGRPFALNENGIPASYQLALDEVYDPTAPVNQRLRKIQAKSSAAELLTFAESEAQRLGRWPGLVAYPEKGPQDAAHRRVLTEQVLLKTTDAPEAEKLAINNGLKVTGRPAYAKQHLVAEAASPLAALDALATMMGDAAVLSMEPLLMRLRMRKVLLNDPYLQDQWHLKNTGQAGGKKGVDIGIDAVWQDDDAGLSLTQGQGIRIAIVDDGLQMNHPDLIANVDLSPNHYDWNGEDTDPSAESGDDHGTAVAGLVAARGNNNIGISGVAPRATLVGFRLIADMSTAITESESVIYGNDVIQVKNNSWGYPDGYPFELGTSSELMQAAMEEAAATGRGGLGTLSVWASGNGRHIGDQGNKDAYSNSIYGIAVGSITNKGKLTLYSEGGSHLCVVAPSAGTKGGMITTDLMGIAGANSGSLKNLSDVDYTNDFNGTSASAPVVSGVIALMLQANPHLNWRDVKEILLRSSVKILPKNKGWTERANWDEWEAEMPPIKHHESYGGGLINAPNAIRLAKVWPSLGSMVSISRSEAPPSTTASLGGSTKGTTLILAPLPEEKKVKTKATRLNLDFSNQTALRVEHVTVRVNATHARRGDLTIKLISPSGTISTLATYSKRDTGANYTDWTFSSVRHWGESSRGIWSVVASEPEDDVDGTLGSVTVAMHGTAYPAVLVESAPISQLVPENSSTDFTAVVETPAFSTTTRQWFKKGKAIPDATKDVLSFPAVQLGDAGLYSYTVENLIGLTEIPVSLGVVRTAIAGQQVLAGKTATFKVEAAGPDLRYQWFIGSQALRDDGRITGSRSATLKVKKVTLADSNDYYCQVSMGDLNLNTLRANLAITIPPSLELFEAPLPSIVSSFTDHPIVALNGATGYRATGLPPGVKIDKATGSFIGRPTKPGTYNITLIASNAAGSSPPVSFVWEVADLPEGTVGTYRGLVERYDLYNQGYGGAFTLTIGKTGLFTGTVTQGKLRTPFKGALDAYAGEVFSTGTVSLRQPAKADPLVLTFTLENGRIDGSMGRDEDDEYASLWALKQWIALPGELASLPGRYNVPLMPEETSAIYPLGSGYLSLAVSAKGRINYAGRLADGTALTGGGIGLAEGILPLHHMLYKKTGSVQGSLALDETRTFFSAEMDWFKSPQPANAATRVYRNGFPLHTLSGTGGRYTAPAAGQLLLDLPLTENNARLTFSEGGLFIPFSQTFSLVLNNKAVFPAATGNPHQLKLTLNAKTGLISGKGATMDIDPANPALNRQRAGTGSALIIPGLDRAEGHFLLPADTSKTAQILSGRLRMLPASALD